MDIEVMQSHPALPEAAALEVAVLVKLGASSTGTAQADALHVGFCLDHSGSMADQSGVVGMTKLDALKAAVQGALQLLEGWGATVTLSAFSDRATHFCERARLQGPADTQVLCAKVERLNTAGGTSARTAMKPVLEALLPRDHVARRLILVTDGEFNSDSIKPCRELARRAGEAGVAVWAFATGVTYNEAYLRELVDLGAAGGMFCHVSDLAALRDRLDEELGAIATASNAQVDLRLAAGQGCRIAEVTRLTPVQTLLNAQPVARLHDHLDVLDARGQGYVIRVSARGLSTGVQRLLDVNLQWTEGGVRHVHDEKITLNVLPAGAVIPAANGQVLTTVLTARAARATVLGNAALATQLYSAAGQTQLADKLSALGTALPTGSDAARALRTEVLGSTRLVALGTAQVPGTRGGTP